MTTRLAELRESWEREFAKWQEAGMPLLCARCGQPFAAHRDPEDFGRDRCMNGGGVWAPLNPACGGCGSYELYQTGEAMVCPNCDPAAYRQWRRDAQSPFTDPQMEEIQGDRDRQSPFKDADIKEWP